MIQARIRKQYAAGPDSAGFPLDIEFHAAAGVRRCLVRAARAKR